MLTRTADESSSGSGVRKPSPGPTCNSECHGGNLRTTMNIIVCVKHVPDATADRKFEDDNTVDRVGVDGLLSELDEYAVEQALQLKEKAGEATRSR